MLSSLVHAIRVLMVPLAGIATSIGAIVIFVLLATRVSAEIPGFFGPPATPTPMPTRQAPTSARDTIILVTSQGPVQLDPWSYGCGGDLASFACDAGTSDPLTWIDSSIKEVVPLSGITGWEQLAPNRWRFYLRPGVTFHNGEPWTAYGAKFGIDIQGDRATAGNGANSFGFHGFITGEVVDDLTVDVVCEVACPILPRTAMSLKFQAPQWYRSASVNERSANAVGIGPYKVVEWRRGEVVRLEAFENYKPNSAPDGRFPSIQNVIQYLVPETSTRAAVVQTGQADLVFDIEPSALMSQYPTTTRITNGVYTLVADNIWDPALKDRRVRMALAHAINCKELVGILYEGRMECYGNIAPPGTLGITPENSAPYPYDPDKARQLLEEAGYNPETPLIVYAGVSLVRYDIGVLERIQHYWSDVGVNVGLSIVDQAKLNEIVSSGCGRLGNDALDCVRREPPAPLADSSHYYATVMSNESLDYQPSLLSHTSCFNVNSRVCNLVPGWEDRIIDAITTPLGPERTRKMEGLAQIVHDEFWFIPLFQVVRVDAAVEDLEWTPRSDSRIRVNAMRFLQ
jgi:ABC-type transport system substrate-binding protein